MIPRRSVLYLPGSNERALDKARSLPCDSIIFDLEDAVAPASKTTARDQVNAAIGSGDYGYRELIVRVNALDTPWGADDVAMAAKCAPHGVLFPKVGSADTVHRAIETLDACGGSSLPVWLMIETPQSIIDVSSIAMASERISALVLGTSDLVKELRARHTPTRDNLSYALQHCVMAARAASIDVLDGVHLDFRNLDTFRLACDMGRDMGFDGKTLIHPGQVEIANEVFGLDPSAIEHARRVLDTWQAAQHAGLGVAELDGQLIENLHAAEASRILEFADALSAREIVK